MSALLRAAAALASLACATGFASPASALTQPNGAAIPASMGCNGGAPTGLLPVFARSHVRSPASATSARRVPPPPRVTTGQHGTCEHALALVQRQHVHSVQPQRPGSVEGRGHRPRDVPPVVRPDVHGALARDRPVPERLRLVQRRHPGARGDRSARHARLQRGGRRVRDARPFERARVDGRRRRFLPRHAGGPRVGRHVRRRRLLRVAHAPGKWRRLRLLLAAGAQSRRPGRDAVHPPARLRQQARGGPLLLRLGGHLPDGERGLHRSGHERLGGAVRGRGRLVQHRQAGHLRARRHRVRAGPGELRARVPAQAGHLQRCGRRLQRPGGRRRDLPRTRAKCATTASACSAAAATSSSAPPRAPSAIPRRACASTPPASA